MNVSAKHSLTRSTIQFNLTATSCWNH